VFLLVIADAFAKGCVQKKNRKTRKKKIETKREVQKESGGETEREKCTCTCPLSRLKFESRHFLSRRNESPCTRTAKVPGSCAETLSYYFYGPETSAGIIIISPGRGRARSSAPSATSTSPVFSPSDIILVVVVVACFPRYNYTVSLHSFSSFGRSLWTSLSLPLSLVYPTRVTIASPLLSSR